ncbi:hypothetical protein [Janthinobacterium sp. DSP2-3-3]|uniref:hypothetical protein n=1 Tax=Janthinobacterium sp. DSP2-3-3 TaxID=2804596 RepID=UPI003CEA98EF
MIDYTSASGAFKQNKGNNESIGNIKLQAHQENILLKNIRTGHARGMPNMAITPIIADSTPR